MFEGLILRWFALPQATTRVVDTLFMVALLRLYIPLNPWGLGPVETYRD